MNGLILLDKPPGISSAGAVNTVKRLLPRGSKIGHAGTLDPFASGLLVLLVGRATKRCETLMNQPKQYEGIIRLGATTATDDPESPPKTAANPTIPSLEAVNNALRQFIGAIEQLPPAYSALKIAGQRACDRIRAGQSVQVQPRLVHVYEIALLHYDWPDVKVRIGCGRGTYIRAIARDLCEMLGVGGYLIQLRRTRSGDFGVEDAVTIEKLAEEGVERHLRP